MVKNTGQTEAARRLLIACVGLLALFSILPLSVTGWVSYLSGVPRALVIPASSQLTKFATWVGGPTIRRGEMPIEGDVHRTLLEQQTVIAQLRAENERLQRSLSELGAIMKLDPGSSSITSLVAPVVGSFSGSPGSTIRVKAGASDGVTKGTVAVGPLLQIVGIVTDVDAATCTVQIFTARDANTDKKYDRTLAAISVNEAESLDCVLSPAPGGVLKGDITWPADPAARERLVPLPGQYVRLKATSPWPRAANMLIIGTVESVEQSATAPGRKAVVVRPTIDPLSRVGEVILRIEKAAVEHGTTSDKPSGGNR